jgi:hypothetical protein
MGTPASLDWQKWGPASVRAWKGAQSVTRNERKGEVCQEVARQMALGEAGDDVEAGGAPPAAARERRPRARGGMYSRLFTDEEVAELATSEMSSIDDEVALLKIAIRRALELGASLREIGAGTDALGRALKVQYALKGKSAQSLDEALARALEEVGREMGFE